MSNRQRLESLRCEVDRLDESLALSKAANERAARTTLAIAASLALIVVAFVLANYLNLRAEWTSAKFSESLGKELEQLEPSAREELRKLGSAIVPVYLEAGESEVRAMGPAIAARVEDELELLGNGVRDGVRDHVRAAQARVSRTVEDAIVASFPQVTNRTRSHVISERFRATAEESLAVAVNTFDDRFGERVEEFERALLAFDLTDSDETRVDLQKRFITLWLDLLKDEIVDL